MNKALPNWPKKDGILFILDLNGTLLHRITRSHLVRVAKEHANYRPPNCVVNGNPIFFRPGHCDFLQRLLGLGQVAVWTSAMPKNAHPMVMHTFNGLLTKDMINRYRRPSDGPWREGPHELLFVWSQDRCDTRRAPGQEKPEFRKDLERAWKAYPNFSSRNTIVIDDSPEKLSAHTSNLIAIPEFLVTDDRVDHTQDNVLVTLATYLEEMLVTGEIDDVTSRLRERPPAFTTEATTRSAETTATCPELDALITEFVQTGLHSEGDKDTDMTMVSTKDSEHM